MNPKEILNLLSVGEIRVRFAPSPTGHLHIGGARAALFNYLFAKKNKGIFVLRIEDTDKERSSPEFEKDITESLKWLGIHWDEGPKNSQDIGNYGPYRQSKRKVYEGYVEKLLEEDKAYYCFCSPEEIEAERQYLMARGRAPKYSGKCSKLNREEIQEKLKSSSNRVIRLRSPIKKIKFKDIIRQEVEFDSEIMGDMVIAKDSQTPLYNLAVVIDDYEMKISHIIRGEEHISNTPKQILIAEALNIPIPIYAHLPLVLATDRSKLSKRHGSVSVIEYQKQGYLPEALVNFLSLLGWNPGTDREIYSMNSLIKDFSLEKVQKSGAVFNVNKLDFINGFYIRQKNIDDLTQLCIPYLAGAGLIVEEEMGKYRIGDSGEETSFEFIRRVIFLHQERMKKLSEISEFADFFFKKEIEYETDLLIWKNSTREETLNSLDKIQNILSEIDSWAKEEIERKVAAAAEKIGDRGKIFWPLRTALTGKRDSAGPIEVAEIMGKEKCLKRIGQAIKKIKE